MSLEDKLPARGVQSHSSSVQSTPDKSGHLGDTLGHSELLQEFLKSCRGKDPLWTCFDKEKKQKFSPKDKMVDQQVKTGNKTSRNQESKKANSCPSNQAVSRKQSRKGENPARVTPVADHLSDFACSSSWTCKNSACRAILSIGDSFCRRCSCCICHRFDDNKDPSLWLVCESESGQDESCGLSCHIECAFQQEKVGVVNLGQFMQLDGSYCCASCGKVSGILGCWKKQLAIAKDARRLDVLCYRMFLSYRLLDGTSRFKELHEIVDDVKKKLEAEVGPIDGDSCKMARGLVSRLSIAGDVQGLCSQAIERADGWLVTISNGNPNGRVLAADSLPAACKFVFQEVTSSSLVIVLVELPTPLTDSIKGYKLWLCKTLHETFSEQPVCIFPREKRRISITNLQPCTQYTFRIVSYTEDGDLGHSEAKCFTESVEIIHRNPNSTGGPACKEENHTVEGNSSDAKGHSADTLANGSGFKVRDLGKILHLAWAQQQGCQEGFCSADVEQCCGGSDTVKESQAVADHQSPPISRGLDLNIEVPDLNEDVLPPFESSRDEDDGCTLGQAVVADDDAASHGNEKNALVRPNGSGDSQAWVNGQNGEGAAVNSQADICRKRASSANEENHECDSTLVNGSPLRMSAGLGNLDENFESCVKTIRRLECQGYIKPEFRLKLLTWFSLRSTDQERRVVNTFIRTLIDDPKSLAAQLVDSFSDIVSSKRQKNGFCNKLWH